MVLLIKQMRKYECMRNKTINKREMNLIFSFQVMSKGYCLKNC